MDIAKLTNDCIQWIKDWFEENGPNCNAVIGISGGKDSTIVAKLCVEALGTDRVIGVLIPNGEQMDINDSLEVCKLLNIKHYTINIKDAFDSLMGQLGEYGDVSNQTKTNIPPRLRMTVLYAVSQSNNGRVANTCNYSEDYVGYSTKYGDAAGDFSPLGDLMVEEILAMGDYLGLPYDLVHKTPIDGLNTNEDGSYVTDEQGLGFSYQTLDKYLKGDIYLEETLSNKIEAMHRRAEKKSQMQKFKKFK